MKPCSKCKKVKFTGSFHKRTSSKDGRQSWCKECVLEHHRSPGPAKSKDRNLRRNYGITLHDYEAMFVQQSGCCRICEQRMGLTHVDHCHESGEVRGLLCPPCNKGIGFLKDSAALLERAKDYVNT